MNEQSDDMSIEELADEFADRCRRGENPTIEEYEARFPHLADRIRRLFPMMIMMEDHKPLPSPELVAPPALHELGEFDILREIGRGGMGIVYEAEHKTLGRRVALKVLPTHSQLSPDHVERFEREARAAARLHHTNIVPVFEVGHDEGLSYYVMQYISGAGLDVVLRELERLDHNESNETVEEDERSVEESSAIQVAAGLVSKGSFEGSRIRIEENAESPDSSVPGGVTSSSESTHGAVYWRNAANVAIQIADALDYAHRHGVMHRDVKPSNILLDVDGTAWITDFGLAKDDQSDDLTRTGDIIGTLRYMAPERLSGKTDARSEVYALGLTLYELLTMRPAYDQLDRDRLIDSLIHLDPPRPRKVNRGVPRDLETIVMKAIDRDPAKRYASAADLGQDLQRFVEDRPISARRVSSFERAWKWAKRRPAIAILTVSLTLAILAGAAGVIWQWSEKRVAQAASEEKTLRIQVAEDGKKKADSLRKQAEGQRTRAEQAEALNQRLAYIADMRLAQQAWEDENVDECLLILSRYEKPGANDQRGPEWHLLRRQCLQNEFTINTTVRDYLQVARFTGDGKQILFGTAKGIDIYDTESGKHLRKLTELPIAMLEVNPVLPQVVCGATERLVVLDWRTGKQLFKLPPTGNMLCPPLFDPSGRFLTFAPNRNLITIKTNAGEPVLDIPLKIASQVSALAFAGKYYVVGTADGIVHCVDEKSNNLHEHGIDGAVGKVAAYQNEYVSTGSQLRFFDQPGEFFSRRLPHHEQRQRQPTIKMTDRRALLVADGPVLRYYPSVRRRLRPEEIKFLGHRGAIVSVDYNARCDRLMTASIDGTIKLWKVPAYFSGLYAPKQFGAALAFDSRGERLVVANYKGQDISIVKLADGEKTAVLKTDQTTSPSGGTWSADETRLLTYYSRLGLARLWDTESQKIIAEHKVDFLHSADMRSEGDLAVLATSDQGLLLWDFKSPPQPLPDSLKRKTNKVCFHPQGDLFAVAYGEKPNTGYCDIDIWSISKRKRMTKLSLPGQAVRPMVFSPDGKQLAAGYTTLAVWDTKTWSRGDLPRASGIFTSYDRTVQSLRFSPDGQRLLAGTMYGEAEIWDPVTRRLSVTLPRRRGSPQLMNSYFRSDGTIMTATGGGKVYVWDGQSAE